MNRIVAGMILLTGLAIRLPGLAEPMLGFHPTRQYRSAILARGYAVDTLGLSPSQREASRLAAAQQFPIEPPIFEHIGAAIYRLAGREDVRGPRLFGVLAWIAGAGFLWWLARQLWPRPTAGLAALAVFLFLPFGIPASQAFQPDGLMTALTVAAVACAVHDDTRRTRGSVLLLAISSAIAILVKPMAAFLIFPVLFVLSVGRRGWWSGFIVAGALALAAIVPAAAWYVVAAPSAGEGRMFPQLLRTSGFWLGWLRMIDVVVWWPVAVAGLAGLAAARGRARYVLLALGAGYVALGLVFTYHIHTHNYYSLPLIPVIALSVGALAHRIDSAIGAPPLRRAAGWAGATLLVAGAAGAVVAADVLHPSPDLRTKVADYERIGRVVGSGARVVSLDDSYGFSLNYHGYLVVANAPLSIDRSATLLAGGIPRTAEQLMATLDADFFVATVQPELDGWGNLRQMLEERYVVADRGGSPEHWRYVIFDLRHPQFAVTPKQLSVFALTDGRLSSSGRVTLWTAPSAHWRVGLSPQDPIEVRPADGTGPAVLQLAARPSGAAVDRAIDVPIYDGAATAPSAVIKVRFRSFATRPEGQPIGSVDGPPDPVALGADPIVFQGWALDPLDLRRVRVDVVDAAGRTRLLGETHGDWMRPDVAKIVPDFHDIFNSGWTFTLDPAALRGTSLPAMLRFYGESGDGRVAEIGKRTVRMR